jgi:hypothetical protein
MVNNYINFNSLNLHITPVSIAKPSPACACPVQPGPAQPIQAVFSVDPLSESVFADVALRISLHFQVYFRYIKVILGIDSDVDTLLN